MDQPLLMHGSSLNDLDQGGYFDQRLGKGGQLMVFAYGFSFAHSIYSWFLAKPMVFGIIYYY